MTSALNLRDLQSLCRACLSQSNTLLPLDQYPNRISGDKSDSTRSRTTGELMMACANVQIASSDGLPQSICLKCIVDLEAAFAYKTMCEKSDEKLRCLLREHLSRVTVKLERLDDQKDSEQEWRVNNEAYPFEVNWFPQSVEEIPVAGLIPKVEEIISISVEPEIKIEPTDSNQPIDDNSTGFDSLGTWDNDFQMDESGTMNGVSDQRTPKEIVRSGKDSKAKTKKEKTFLCEFCSATFYSIGNLTTHYVTHSGRKDFICDICKRQYSTKACLKDHMRYHGDKKELYCHICPHCGKGYAYRNVLSEHIRVHTGERPYQCEICNSRFHTKHNFRMHQKKHEPVRRFICETCGKGFIKNDKLIIHTRTHTGERPYKCNVCELTFSQNSTLRAHMRNHTGERRFHCNICDERFIQNYQLISHRRKAGHWIPGNEPPPKTTKPVKTIPKRKIRRKNNDLFPVNNTN